MKLNRRKEVFLKEHVSLWHEEERMKSWGNEVVGSGVASDGKAGELKGERSESHGGGVGNGVKCVTGLCVIDRASSDKLTGKLCRRIECMRISVCMNRSTSLKLQRGGGDCDQRRPRGGWKRESGSNKRCGAGHLDKLRHCLMEGGPPDHKGGTGLMYLFFYSGIFTRSKGITAPRAKLV
eukprot:13888_5